MPDEAVKAIMEFDDSDIKATVVMDTGVEQRSFNGDKAVAVRDYLEMCFAYGVRRDPR